MWREAHSAYRNGQQSSASLRRSCGHTFFGPFQGIGSSGEASTTHVEYTITLRENDGAHGGWLRETAKILLAI
jgi:hypothetical protein